MFVSVQFPMADVRRFLDVDTGRLEQPDWQLPNFARNEFVRGFGSAHRRRDPGADEWIGEQSWCGVSRALRFSTTLRRTPQRTGKYQLSGYCGFRRLLFDGRAVARFELGIGCGAGRQFGRGDDDGLALLNDILSTPMRVRSAGGQLVRCTLSRAASHLREAYCAATTRRVAGAALTRGERWWIGLGAPLVLLECREDADVFQVPSLKVTRTISARVERVQLRRASADGAAGGEAAGPTLEHYLARIGTQECRLWVLRRRHTDADRDFAKKAATHLLRLHAELECVQHVIRCAREGRFSISRGHEPAERLERYLFDALGLLLQERREGLPQSDILAAAQQMREKATEGEALAIRTQLKDARIQVRRRVEQFLDAQHRTPAMVISMEDRSVHIQGSTFHNQGVTAFGGDVRHAHAVVSTHDAAGAVDPAALAGELDRLRVALRAQATSLEHEVALGEVAAAQVAAKNGDTRGALDRLRRAGSWALDVATKIGVSLATEALKAGTGVGNA